MDPNAGNAGALTSRELEQRHFGVIVGCLAGVFSRRESNEQIGTGTPTSSAETGELREACAVATRPVEALNARYIEAGNGLSIELHGSHPSVFDRCRATRQRIEQVTASDRFGTNDLLQTVHATGSWWTRRGFGGGSSQRAVRM